jgi:hypothetical protein
MDIGLRWGEVVGVKSSDDLIAPEVVVFWLAATMSASVEH